MTDQSVGITSSHKYSRLALAPASHLLLILLAGLLGYANTFNVPFQFDDGRVIIQNSLIKNPGMLWPLSGARWFCDVTFALNYALGGLTVTGYHIVNLIIHQTTALLVYYLTVLTLRTPLFRKVDSHSPYAALVAGLLFVAHPVHTQAVTYVAQRYASLATLLFLAALIFYIRSRVAYCSGGSIKRTTVIAWYAMALMAALLAMKTKEIAFTLPLVTALYEFSFITGRRTSERFRFLMPMLLLLAVIPIGLIRFGAAGTSITSSASDIPRLDYLLTQFRVIVTYLRLLILPVNQMMDYNFPVFHSLFEPQVFVSFLLLLGLALISLFFLMRGRGESGAPELTIAGFGGLWFFITLSVESSIIPITDVIFEHRLYLPAVGIVMAVAVAGRLVIGRFTHRWPRYLPLVWGTMVCLITILIVATHLRNRVWSSTVSLWEDVVLKSPGNARAHAVIGIALIGEKKIDQAIAHFQESVAIKPDYVDGYICLGNAYFEKGLPEEGYRQYQRALAIGIMDFESRSQLFINIGMYFLNKGQPDQAVYNLQEALALTPGNAAIYYDLSQAYRVRGDMAEAVAALTRARQLSPERY